jgi:hypothetical protein
MLIADIYCFRAALRYAVHDSLVTAAFSGLFLLKMASLFPTELDLDAIVAQVEQLAQLLSDVAAERFVIQSMQGRPLKYNIGFGSYALTLRIMLANLRRKMGIMSRMSTPVSNLPPPSMSDGGMMVSPTFVEAANVPAPFTVEELGFTWPSDLRNFTPATIPVWLQEQVSQPLVIR